MSSIGTDRSAWMFRRYWSLERRMSLVRRALPESGAGAGCSRVSGAWTRSVPGARRARRSIAWRTVDPAITLPSSTARLRSDSKSFVLWRRSRTVDVGVSTTTCVDAVAISSARGGWARPRRPRGGAGPPRRRAEAHVVDAPDGAEEGEREAQRDPAAKAPQLAQANADSHGPYRTPRTAGIWRGGAWRRPPCSTGRRARPAAASGRRTTTAVRPAMYRKM